MKTTKVKIDELNPNPYQPRFEIDTASQSMLELAESIKQNGLLQLPTVIEENNKHYILFGHRRVAACKMLGYKEIDVILHPSKNKKDESRFIALVENIQRVNLNPVELGKSYREALDETGLTVREFATKIGKSPTEIIRCIKFVALDQKILDYYNKNPKARKDSFVLYELCKLKGNPAQVEIFIRYQEENLTRDEVMLLINKNIQKKIIEKTIDFDTKLQYDKQGIKIRAAYLTALPPEKKKQFEDEISSLLEKYKY